MSMAVAPFIPHTVPLVVGTRQIAAHERHRGRPWVSVIEPPVDTVANSADAVAEADVRRYETAGESLHVVVVSRLVDALKGEGLMTAISEVPRIAPGAVLTVVGDGPRRSYFEAAAESVNHELGRRAVVLTGPLEDPRPAYASADIALGMGGSALRGMAFGKPLVVQGEKGFWSLLTPQTLPLFRWTGWYGIGDGRESGVRRLREALRPLVEGPTLRQELGEFARRTVEAYFGLDEGARVQERVYRAALDRSRQRTPRAADAAGAARFLLYKRGEWRDRARRRSSSEDFNALPISLEGSSDGGRTLVVYRAAHRWEERNVDDARVLDAAAGRFQLLWIDPPGSSARRYLQHSPAALTPLADVGWRLRSFGRSAAAGNRVASAANRRALSRACAEVGIARRVEVVSLPAVAVGGIPVDGTVTLPPALPGAAGPPADVAVVRDETSLRRNGGPSVHIRLLTEDPAELAALVSEVARP